jgi:tRNA-(ms[2]io[6]A)-hydroxylase
MALQLKTASSPLWLEAVLGDFNSFLRDHASCEKKASGMAMSIISHYPDKPLLIREMLNLAVEELSHYRDVMRLLLDRGLEPAKDVRDDYVNSLQGLMDRGRNFYLLDRLLLSSIVEARGSERFGMIADALPQGQLKHFYEGITSSENRHWQLFIALAEQHCDPALIPDRLDTLLQQEAEIVKALPIRAALH